MSSEQSSTRSKDKKIIKIIGEELKRVHVDCGRVEVNNTCVKIITIANKSDETLSYEAERDEMTSRLDCAFQVSNVNWTLEPGEQLKWEIAYRPILPFCKSIDYFRITDSRRVICKIIASGYCVGPAITCINPKFLMIRPCINSEVTAKIELINNSETAGIFAFDFDDETQSELKVDAMSGTVLPLATKIVTLSFIPQRMGVYRFRLPCLILNQSEIVIEVFGYCGDLEGDELNYYVEEANVKSYMHDCSLIESEEEPIISLSINYIDFGKTNSKKDAASLPAKVVCVTNQSGRILLAKWEEDQVFKIMPLVAIIKPKQSVLFEVSFQPDQANFTYARDLILLASSEACEGDCIEFPLIETLRCIGHSFYCDSQYEMLLCKLPKRVTMPPCVPLVPVYNTFLIETSNSSPVTFQFIPPYESNYVVKPMLGMIKRHFQIITVGLFPLDAGEKEYIERWEIEFTINQSKSRVFIEFEGYSDIPKLFFGNDGAIDIGAVYPQCEKTITLAMRNISRHRLQYSVSDLPEVLRLANWQKGIIEPNEILYDKLTFSPNEIKVYNYVINFSLSLANDNRTEPSKEWMSYLQLQGSGGSGKLVAFPDCLEFDKQTYGFRKSLCFHIFNFSNVDLHFTLTCKHRSFPVGDLNGDLKIEPSNKTIAAGMKQEIIVTLTPKSRGYYQLMINYILLSNKETTCSPILSELAELCKINSLCVLPYFQIKDLLYYITESKSSKISMWKMMNINKLNSALKLQEANETEEVRMYFPVLIEHEDPAYVKLLIVNPTEATVSFSMKRVQLCSCKKSKQRKSLTFYEWVLECKHKDTCNITPKNVTLKPKEQDIITFELHYNVIGKTELQWIIEVDHNRQIVLAMEVTTSSKQQGKLMPLYGNTMMMYPVYVGDLEPAYQMFWICNNTEEDLDYCLDVSAFKAFNVRHCSHALYCENPTGTIEKSHKKPLLFRYHPLTSETFELEVPIQLGNKMSKIILIGESTMNPNISHPYEPTSPFQDKFLIPEIPVYFNRDYIMLPPYPTHSLITRLVMVYNNFTTDVLGYEWQSYEVPNVIKIQMDPSKGIIQPMALHTLCLKVTTGGYPNKIDVNYKCQFINLSERRAYQKYKMMESDPESQGDDCRPRSTRPKEPVPFYKALTIFANVYALSDEDLHTTAKGQLSQPPSNEYLINEYDKKSEIHLTSFEEKQKMKEMTSLILEQMIWDIVFSESFKCAIVDKISSNKLTYSQICMNLAERRKLENKLLQCPPLTQVQQIFEEMIFFSLHEEYSLGSIHYNQKKDIREKTYINEHHVKKANIIEKLRSKISFETLHEKLYDKKQSSYSEGPVVSFEGVNTEENV